MRFGAVANAGASKAQSQVANEAARRTVPAVYSGLLASFLLGWAPVLGKFAYRAQVDPISLAALRTLVAAVFLWCVYLIFWRSRILIDWRSLLSCLLVGAINGVGSLFYYTGLARLDASRAALLGAIYPVWVVLFLSASGQHIKAGTLAQLVASLTGAVLITSPWHSNNPANYLATMLMLASAAVNGWYMVMGQWVLAEVPSRSGTLYIMTGMALTVSAAWLLDRTALPAEIPLTGLYAIVALGLTTALSRMAMFFSLEKLGGVQTAILNLVELSVSLTLAFLFLGDRLMWYQWAGAVLLLGGGLLARYRVEKEGVGAVAFDPMAAAVER
jgi:drug/metabolite transporter (DMT)-like permease